MLSYTPTAILFAVIIVCRKLTTFLLLVYCIFVSNVRLSDTAIPFDPCSIVRFFANHNSMYYSIKPVS